jgi:hypothetical protein
LRIRVVSADSSLEVRSIRRSYTSGRFFKSLEYGKCDNNQRKGKEKLTVNPNLLHAARKRIKHLVECFMCEVALRDASNEDSSSLYWVFS